MRVTLDANIYISALQFGGKPMRLIQMGLDREFDLDVSEPILSETFRILREKFGWAERDLREAEAAIRIAAHLVVPNEVIDAVPSDPDDNRVLECAVAAGSDVLVSGDLDLLRLKAFRTIRIERPAAFLAEWDAPIDG